MSFRTSTLPGMQTGSPTSRDLLPWRSVFWVSCHFSSLTTSSSIWIANFCLIPGEVSFIPGNATYYDVSSIVENKVGFDQEDGVHFFFPKFGNGGNRISGCTGKLLPNSVPHIFNDSLPIVDWSRLPMPTYIGLGSPSL